MDWLRKLPGVGPLVTRLMATHAWRSYERLDRVKWTRLAAAMTFVSFVALFPLLTVAAAVGAATLSVHQQKQLQDKIAEQVPGISDQLDINTLVQNAGTIGVIAGAVLLLTGIGWVGQMRDCLRAVWELPDSEENPLLRKLVDGGVLVGLGGAVLVTIGASAAASTTVGWTARLFGVDQNGWGGGLLHAAAFAVAVLADFLLLLYLLTLLPGVQPSRHAARRRRSHRRRGLRTAQAAAQQLYEGHRVEEHVRRLRGARRAAPVDQLHRETAAVLRVLDGDGARGPGGPEARGPGAGGPGARGRRAGRPRVR